MMEYLLPLAAKSLLVAGCTLVLLKLMQRRSAADRSWIAHLGLAGILILPIVTFALPALEVPGPAMLVSETAPAVHSAATAPVNALPFSAAPEVASTEKPFPVASATSGLARIDWTFWGYVLPAGLFFLLTLIALVRLVVLKSRANVLVDGHWLTALAQAQRRMGFKNGTALLTSDDLRSPVSWGLFRPVILLNTSATEARGEAEAIIAHELAHVARLDWAKLMLARVAVAIFWFNPLVWLLAREAHQLREEAADDAVLAADIEDTEYANLLVGIARHECRGLLLGAHGVAPARNSLSRRVKRVLDAALDRAPGGWKWSSAAAFFAAGMTVPVAALQFVAPTVATAAERGNFVPDGKAKVRPMAAPATIPGIAGVVPPADVLAGPGLAEGTVMTSSDGSTISHVDGKIMLRSNDGGTITVMPPDSNGQRRTILRSSDGSTLAFADAHAVPGIATAIAGSARALDQAAERKAVGASPQYVRAIRKAAPAMNISNDDIVEFAAVGVTPEYLRELASAGFRLSADDVVDARAVGIDARYVRDMAGAGYGRLSIDDLTELRAVGVTAGDVARFRKAHGKLPSVETIVEAKAMGLDPEDIDPDD